MHRPDDHIRRAFCWSWQEVAQRVLDLEDNTALAIKAAWCEQGSIGKHQRVGYDCTYNGELQLSVMQIVLDELGVECNGATRRLPSLE